MMSSLPECKTKDPPKFLSSWLGVHVIGGIFISVNNFTGLTVASFFWKPELSEFPGYGERPLVLESSGNLLNSAKKYEVYGRQ